MFLCFYIVAQQLMLGANLKMADYWDDGLKEAMEAGDRKLTGISSSSSSMTLS